MKTPAFSRFRSIFPVRENKNAAKILAESKEESLSQIFRERHLVNFSGGFWYSRTSRTGRTNRRFC